jgi:hypothetical protein
VGHCFELECLQGNAAGKGQTGAHAALAQSELVTALRIVRRYRVEEQRTRFARPRRRGMSSGRSRKPRTATRDRQVHQGQPRRCPCAASVGDRTSPRPTSGIFPREKCFAGGRALVSARAPFERRPAHPRRRRHRPRGRRCALAPSHFLPRPPTWSKRRPTWLPPRQSILV